MKLKTKIGKVFGSVLVVEKAYHNGTNTFYKCLCDCGEERVLASSAIHDKTNCHCERTEGIYWVKRDKKWNSTVLRDGKRHSIGRFEEKEDAITAQKEALRVQSKPKPTETFEKLYRIAQDIELRIKNLNLSLELLEIENRESTAESRNLIMLKKTELENKLKAILEKEI